MQHVLYMPMPGFKQSPLNKDNILDDDIRPCCLLLFSILCVALSTHISKRRKPEQRARAPDIGFHIPEQRVFL